MCINNAIINNSNTLYSSIYDVVKFNMSFLKQPLSSFLCFQSMHFFLARSRSRNTE